MSTYIRMRTNPCVKVQKHLNGSMVLIISHALAGKEHEHSGADTILNLLVLHGLLSSESPITGLSTGLPDRLTRNQLCPGKDLSVQLEINYAKILPAI